jgi:hypothetical protein
VAAAGAFAITLYAVLALRDAPDPVLAREEGAAVGR